MTSSAPILKTGKIFFAVAILAIGLIHLITHNFPKGLLPVPANAPGRATLVYADGIALLIAGLLLLTKSYQRLGAILATVIWLALIVFLHLPKLAANIHDPGGWTPAFEVVGLFAGALILVGISASGSRANRVLLIGRYLFALALIVFGVQHYLYAQFVAGLIPAWIPAHLFWNYLVVLAFIAAAISLLVGKAVKLSGLLLALMFLLWLALLHLPRVTGNLHTETEWTSLFNVLAFGGVSLIVAGTAKKH